MTRKTSSTPRFAVNRASGESYDAFARRAHRTHTSDALRAKVYEGRWLPAEEYERLTGRPGRPVPPVVLESPTSVGEEALGGGPTTTSSRGSALAEHSRALGGQALMAAAMSVATDLAQGRRVDVASTGGRAVRSAARSAAVGVVRTGVEQVAERVVVRAAVQGVVKTTLRTNAVGQMAALLVDQTVDTVQWARGKVDAAEYGRRSAGNVADAAGGLAGAAAGAAIGSVVPLVGTAVGGVVGAIVGSLAAQRVTRRLV
jgi:hypothetical protein